MIGAITRLQLNRIEKRVQDRYSVRFSYTDGVVETIVSRCQELESGGRMIDAIVTNTMLPAIANKVSAHMLDGSTVERVAVDVANGDFTYEFA